MHIVKPFTRSGPFDDAVHAPDSEADTDP
jgi:hypothetical protein